MLAKMNKAKKPIPRQGFAVKPLRSGVVHWLDFGEKPSESYTQTLFTIAISRVKTVNEAYTAQCDVYRAWRFVSLDRRSVTCIACIGRDLHDVG
jgi:hypothetical protein